MHIIKYPLSFFNYSHVPIVFKLCEFAKLPSLNGKVNLTGVLFSLQLKDSTDCRINIMNIVTVGFKTPINKIFKKLGLTSIG